MIVDEELAEWSAKNSPADKVVKYGDNNVGQIPRFIPFWKLKRRFMGLRGGRGSGKSHTVADKLVNLAARRHVRAACMREIQNSIKDSSKQLIEDKIRANGFGAMFKITEKEIICPKTESVFIFRGLQNHTAASVKSLEAYNFAWYEEAQSLSQRSLDLAIPTFRTNSEQVFSWNPENEDDPIELLFDEGSVFGEPENFLCIHSTYLDNPLCPEELILDAERDKRRNMDKYMHVWLGHFRQNSEARVFKNVRSFHFDTPTDAFFQLGGDWGFSVDPTTLVRCFTGDVVNGKAVYNPDGKTLFIDYELYSAGVEIDKTPEFYDGLVPSAPMWPRKWPIRADSSRPETISYMQRHGYPLLVRANKGPNSVVEGVAFLQDYDIVVHPRCKYTVDEFRFYSYKVDKKTLKVTRELVDDKNHIIDGVRYAIEPLRKVAPQWHVGK